MTRLARYLAFGLWLCAPAPAAWARDGGLENLVGDDLSRFANEAVATFGLVAVPNETASAFAIRNTQQDSNNFSSVQIGGGGVPKFFDRPIYVEGYLGFQRYDPRFLIERDEADDLEIRAFWNGLAATVGAGWSFDVGDNWSIRPIANLTMGHIVSDATVAAGVAEALLDVDLGGFFGDGLTAGGYGASLLATYDYNSPDAEYDIRLRHTHLELHSIGESAGLNARATAITTSAWARARFPIRGTNVFGREAKSMWEASISAYPGDQTQLLGINWLARIGSGLEFDLQDTGLPVVRKGRLAVRYIFGDDYQGISVGLGIGLAD